MRIYLDHNATTPVRPEVADAMDAVQRRVYGNPSSVHREGSAARIEVDRARERVASLLGVAPAAVLFTSGATEANNTALLGVLGSRPAARRRIVATSVEHPSADAAIDDATALVSVIWANNETGAVQPVAEIAALARARGALFHTDATQAVGKIPVRIEGLPVDLLSLSAHKLNGPKGVGALLVRDGLEFEPLLAGGPQERRRRGGTENVAGIAGLGVACALARDELPERERRYAQLRDRLWEGIRAKIPDVRRNGAEPDVLPNTLNVEFVGTAGELLLQALDLEGVAVSSGAACASGSIAPSHVLVAMGRSPAEARGSLRLSVGWGVDESQVDAVLALLPDLVARARRAGAA